MMPMPMGGYPKQRAETMAMRNDMMKAMGEIMLKHAQRAQSSQVRSRVRWKLLPAGPVLVMPGPSSALAQERTWEWHWSTHPMMFMWGAGGLLMMLMMLVFWAAIIAALIFGLRWLIGQGHPPVRDEAFEILRQRYARGDIDRQEFEARKRDLGV